MKIYQCESFLNELIRIKAITIANYLSIVDRNNQSGGFPTIKVFVLLMYV